jgi:hypothetical protein
VLFVGIHDTFDFIFNKETTHRLAKSTAFLSCITSVLIRISDCLWAIVTEVVRRFPQSLRTMQESTSIMSPPLSFQIRPISLFVKHQCYRVSRKISHKRGATPLSWAESQVLRNVCTSGHSTTKLHFKSYKPLWSPYLLVHVTELRFLIEKYNILFFFPLTLKPSGWAFAFLHETHRFTSVY